MNLRLFGKKEIAKARWDRYTVEVRAAIGRPSLRPVARVARSHLVGVSNDGDVEHRLTGACNGCPMSGLTLKARYRRARRARRIVGSRTGPRPQPISKASCPTPLCIGAGHGTNDPNEATAQPTAHY